MTKYKYKTLVFEVPPNPKVEDREENIEVGSDIKCLTQDMETRLNEVAAEGWKVVGIQSVLRGEYSWNRGGYRHGGSGYGYSLTDAFIVVLERESDGCKEGEKKQDG